MSPGVFGSFRTVSLKQAPWVSMPPGPHGTLVNPALGAT